MAALEHAIGAPLPATLDQLVEFARVPDLDDEQHLCLAQAVYFEARGEPMEGQAAVARVIMNRVGDARYPSTICGVVFQHHRSVSGCQFHFACDGLPERPRDLAAWDRANRIAYLVRENWLPDPIGDAKYFHALSVGKPDWTQRLVRIASVGSHVFYSDRRRHDS
jgi:spore germination cell wall hydrolase CwlJ-like protein